MSGSELADQVARALRMGFRVIKDHTWRYVLVPLKSRTTNPATHSNVDADELREMLDGIEWGRDHGVAQEYPQANG
ncbi:hypothetical protein [Mycobacterium intracellulare]|uniref:hypothetical protein n=1 Tax=Mycobacterium intracellulare TaxID=1767 RepID=UPI000BAAB7E2|nr:hypothetical protein [Mycobacterium intracellulare]ASW84788.1 hypothetical protein CKJ61_07695 [Mycobacterium intracellulare]